MIHWQRGSQRKANAKSNAARSLLQFDIPLILGYSSGWHLPSLQFKPACYSIFDFGQPVKFALLYWYKEYFQYNFLSGALSWNHMIDLYIYVPDMSARCLVCNDMVINGVAAAENLLYMCDQAKTTLLLSNLSGCPLVLKICTTHVFNCLKTNMKTPVQALMKIGDCWHLFVSCHQHNAK